MFPKRGRSTVVPTPSSLGTEICVGESRQTGIDEKPKPSLFSVHVEDSHLERKRQPTWTEDLCHDLSISRQLLPTYVIVAILVSLNVGLVNFVHVRATNVFWRDYICLSLAVFLYIVSYAVHNKTLEVDRWSLFFSYIAMMGTFMVTYYILGSGIFFPMVTECKYDALWLTVFPFPASFALCMGAYGLVIYRKHTFWKERVYISTFAVNNAFLASSLTMGYNVASSRLSDPLAEFFLNGLLFPCFCAFVGRFLIVDFCSYISHAFLPGVDKNYTKTRLFYVFQVKVIFHFALQVALLDVTENITFILSLMASNASELVALVINVNLMLKNPLQSAFGVATETQERELRSHKDRAKLNNFVKNWTLSTTKDQKSKLLANFHGEEVAEKVNSFAACAAYMGLQYYRNDGFDMSFSTTIIWRTTFLVIFELIEDLFKRRLLFRLTGIAVVDLKPHFSIDEIAQFVGFVAIGYAAVIVAEVVQQVDHECLALHNQTTIYSN